jgi:hypothetical protein
MTTEEINELVFRIYNARVDSDSGEGSAARMIERDKDGGEKQRSRALFYRPVVIETLVQLGLHERPKPPGRKAKEEKKDDQAHHQKSNG